MEEKTKLITCPECGADIKEISWKGWECPRCLKIHPPYHQTCNCDPE